MEVTGIAHVIFGFTSLVFGACILSLKKGTELHRALGAFYVFSMFGLNLTALLIYRIFGGFGPFHVLSLINLTLLLAGFGAVLLKRPRKKWLTYHYYLMGWSYVGLCAAAASEVTSRVPGWSLAVAVTITTVVVVVVGGWIVRLRERSTIARVRTIAPGG